MSFLGDLKVANWQICGETGRGKKTERVYLSQQRAFLQAGGQVALLCPREESFVPKPRVFSVVIMEDLHLWRCCP